MTAALGWAEMLDKVILDHEQHQRAVGAIRRSLNRQLTLVNDPEEKRIHVHCERDAFDATVMGDPIRLQQVVVNLLTNAIKFTPEGGAVRVSARVTDMAEIQVVDTGKGLSADAIRHVFDEFWQADRDSAPSRGRGVGLGLTIASHLVAAHGGTIDVASPGEGLGSSFTVRLPLATARMPVRHSGGDVAHVI